MQSLRLIYTLVGIGIWLVSWFSATAGEPIGNSAVYDVVTTRSRLQLWPQRSFVQVIKHKAGKQLLSISHCLLHGSWEAACQCLVCSQTQLGRFNTAYVERLNASLRTWLPALARRSRTPARCQDRLRTALFWTGCVYNFCQIHASLQGTPAMAADITSDVWSVRELLLCISVRPKSLHAIL